MLPDNIKYPGVDLVNVVISSTEPGRIEHKIYSHNEYKRVYKIWKNCLDAYYFIKFYEEEEL